MSEVLPELAAKVLSADERNIIQKVSAGETLSSAQREIFEKLKLTGAAEAELKQARDAAILRRWARGETLSKELTKELTAILPSGKAAAARVTSSKYKRKLRHYAEQLGIKGKDPTRKLKRWIERGRENDDGTPRDEPDFPPFDDLPRLGEWWRRNMGWGDPPDYILRLEDRGAAAPSEKAPGAKDAASAGDDDDDTEAPLPMMQVTVGADVAADLGLQQVRSLVVGTFDQMQLALRHGRPQQYASLRREWQQLVNTLRAWERDIFKIQEDRGDMLRVRKLNSETISMFVVMAQSWTNSMFALVAKVAPTFTPDQQRAVVLPLRDSVFAFLKKTRFEKQWVAAEGVILEAEITQLSLASGSV